MKWTTEIGIFDRCFSSPFLVKLEIGNDIKWLELPTKDLEDINRKGNKKCLHSMFFISHIREWVYKYTLPELNDLAFFLKENLKSRGDVIRLESLLFTFSPEQLDLPFLLKNLGNIQILRYIKNDEELGRKYVLREECRALSKLSESEQASIMKHLKFEEVGREFRIQHKGVWTKDKEFFYFLENRKDENEEAKQQSSCQAC